MDSQGSVKITYLEVAIEYRNVLSTSIEDQADDLHIWRLLPFSYVVELLDSGFEVCCSSIDTVRSTAREPCEMCRMLWIKGEQTNPEKQEYTQSNGDLVPPIGELAQRHIKQHRLIGRQVEYVSPEMPGFSF